MKERKASVDLLLQGSPFRGILLFAMPIIAGNIFQQMYSIMDSVIVGNFVGKEALAAIGSGTTIINLLIEIFIGMATGVSAVVAKYYGARNGERLQKTVHTAVAFSILAGVFLIIFGIVITPHILKWMNTPQEMIPSALKYLQTYFCGSLFLVFYNTGTGILRGIGDSRRPLYILILSSISNILLDLLFVCVFRTGIAGAAWATVISQGISAFIVLYVLCRDTGMHQLKPGQIRLEKRTIGEIAKMGIPIGIQSGLIAFSNVVVQTNINYFGVDAVSGCSAFLKIDGILVLPLVSFGLAAMTYTSQNLGAGNIGRIQMGKRATMIICLCYIIPASVFVWIFGTPLISLFSHDKAVIACGKTMVQVMTPGYWMLGVAHVYAGIFRGCGKSFQTMLLMLFNLVVVRFLYLAVAVKIHHTLAVVLSSYTVSWVTVMVSAILMSKFIEKKDNIWNPVDNRKEQ